MRCIAIKVFMVCLGLLANVAHAQFSAFTYQGEVREADTPANGTFDLRFNLFDVATGGSAVAVTQCANNVQVVDGRFAVELDFGGLDMVALFIEISVRRDTGLDCSNATGYTTLAPRQKIGIAPFSATSAFSLNTQLLGGQSPTFYRQTSNLIGTIASGNLGGTYTNALTLNNSLNLFAGNGSGLTALNASNLSQGTLPDARLSSNVALLNRTQAFTGNNTFSGTTIFGSTTTFNAAATFGSTSAFTGLATFNGGIALPATTRTLTLPCGAFHPTSNTLDYLSDGSFLRGVTSGQVLTFDAPLCLPDGATVTQLAAYVLDNDATRSISVSLNRVQQTTTSLSTLAVAGTTVAGVSPSLQETITNPAIAIDNDVFTYALRLSWTVPATPTNMAFHAVKVTYRITTPLP